MHFQSFSACVEHINLSALILKLNEQGLLTSEEEKGITDSTLKLTERITKLLQCVTKKENGWRKFLAALKAEASHNGHTTLLKKLPSVEGTHTHTHTHTHTLSNIEIELCLSIQRRYKIHEVS